MIMRVALTISFAILFAWQVIAQPAEERGAETRGDASCHFDVGALDTQADGCFQILAFGCELLEGLTLIWCSPPGGEVIDLVRSPVGVAQTAGFGLASVDQFVEGVSS